jgi:hypothetical protein
MTQMKTRFALPLLGALALFAASVTASPASARYYGYAPQGGGGAGPYALQCRRYANFVQSQHCTDLVHLGYYRHRYSYYRHHHDHHHYYG